MRIAPLLSSFQPIACSLAMFITLIGGHHQFIRTVLLLTALTSLVLGYSLGRWPAPDAPRWSLWPMVRSWLGLAALAGAMLLFGYAAPIRGAGALALVSLLPAEVARWVGGYGLAMRRLRGL